MLWDRVHFQRDPDLRQRPQDRLALHRAGKADTECLHRKLQRPPTGRTPERNPVPVPALCPRHAGRLAQGLQYRTTPLPPRLADARRVRPDLRPATGPDTAQPAKLRASPRCPTRPNRQNRNQEPCSRWIKVGGNVRTDENDPDRLIAYISDIRKYRCATLHTQFKWRGTRPEGLLDRHCGTHQQG